MLFVNIADSTATHTYEADIVSSDRITLKGNAELGPPQPTFIVCDSAEAVPASPTAPTATNNKTGINLAWTDASLDETGFKVYRKLSTESEAKLLVTQTAVTYSDTDLTEGETAYYHVIAYNGNGDSAKSKAVSATVDSIAPTVATTSPANGLQVAVTDRNLSITFSEKIKVICPSEPNAVASICTDSGSAVSAQGIFNDQRDSPPQYNAKLYGNIASTGTSDTSTLSGDLVGSAETLNNKDTITVTVEKEWIRDMNGIQMESDFVFTFTTP
jgi:fibronectin type 3 domain-containing protein